MSNFIFSIVISIVAFLLSTAPTLQKGIGVILLFTVLYTINIKIEKYNELKNSTQN